MRTGKGRIQIKATQVPVTIGNVTVSPGDIVRGDADGVVVLPQAFEEKLLEVAEEIAANEEKIREHVRNGDRLVDARTKFRYHQLQNRQQ
jgi:regulator of RNase E activity RraA